MMIGDAMTPFDPVLVFFPMLFNFEFDVTVFDVPVFDITLLYQLLQFACNQSRNVLEKKNTKKTLN